MDAINTVANPIFTTNSLDDSLFSILSFLEIISDKGNIIHIISTKPEIVKNSLVLT